MGFHVNVIQGESPPTIGTLIRANALVREFKRHGNFELVFRPVDFRKAGIVVLSDAALGNVAVCGSNQGDVVEKTYKQACYFVLVAEQSLLQGEQGLFNILDARSRRIPRVCRFTYAAETLSAEETLDCGQLARGLLALAQGRQLT